MLYSSYIVNYSFNKLFCRYSKEFNDFISKCLTKDPNVRPTAEDLSKVMYEICLYSFEVIDNKIFFLRNH